MKSDRGTVQVAGLVVALLALAATVVGVWIAYEQLVVSQETRPTETSPFPGSQAGSGGTTSPPSNTPTTDPASGPKPDSERGGSGPAPYEPVDPSVSGALFNARLTLFAGDLVTLADGRITLRSSTSKIGASEEPEVRMLVDGEVLKCAVTTAPLDCGTLKVAGASYRLSVLEVSPEDGSLMVAVDEVR